jgi:glutaminase
MSPCRTRPLALMHPDFGCKQPAIHDERRLSTLATSHLYDEIVAASYLKCKDIASGENAKYIPALANVPSELFGVALATARGEVWVAGDCDVPFALQSVAKPFTAALCIEQEGSAECLLDRIGVANAGFPFNSILATQFFGCPSGNPMLNAGAIASASMVRGCNTAQRFQALLNWYMRCSGSTLAMLTDVYESEAASNYNNKALAYILAAAGRIYCDPLEATDLYTRQGAVGVTVTQLAQMGATLANHGINPVTRERVLGSKHVPCILSMMMLSGLYEESGQWAYTTGLPAKTGVGGGMIAIVPGTLAIAAFSPRLNQAGNSIRAMMVVREIAHQLRINLFDISGWAAI